jgi:hypothetical protein
LQFAVRSLRFAVRSSQFAEVRMDDRLRTILTRQQSAGYPGLAGTEVHATIRISAQLLNEAIAGFLASTTAPVRELTLVPHVGNRIDVRVDPAKAFIPAITVTVAIDRQPQLPADPVLVLRMTGGGAMLRLAGPMISSFAFLPPGIRIDGDRILVDLRAVAQPYDQARLFEMARQIEVATLDGALVVFVHASV